MLLLPHQQRVVEERDEIVARLTKLSEFMRTPTFDALPKEERHRMVQQQLVMNMLADILSDRIAAFTQL